MCWIWNDAVVSARCGQMRRRQECLCKGWHRRCIADTTGARESIGTLILVVFKLEMNRQQETGITTTPKDRWLLVVLWGMFGCTFYLVFLIQLCLSLCVSKVMQGSAGCKGFSKIMRAVVLFWPRVPLPFFSLGLHHNISYQSAAPGAPSVPGAVNGRLLLSFHHCVS